MNLGLSAIFAVIPIVLVFVLMVRYSWPATKAMPLGWIVAIIIAVTAWKMPFKWVMGAIGAGAVNALDIFDYSLWCYSNITNYEKKRWSRCNFFFHVFNI